MTHLGKLTEPETETWYPDDDFQPDPPSQAEIDSLAWSKEWVKHITFSFRKTGCPGVNVAWEISHALSSLANARKAYRLTERERDDMLDAIFRARTAAMITLPAAYNRNCIDKGMQAAAGLVIHWSEDDEQRAARHPHVWLDMVAYARMFRNDLHNYCLMEDIAEREAERRADTIEALRVAARTEKAA